MRVEQFLHESATRFGKKPAIVVSGRTHSYADLARGADRVAAAMVGRGIKRGDRVVVFMDDTFEAVVSAFAILKAGAIASPIVASTDAETLALILARTGATALITEARLASVAAAAMNNIRGIGLVLLCGGDRSTANGSCLVFEEIVGGIGNGPHVDRAGSSSDAALLLHSIAADGTTEAATLSHAEVVAAAANVESETLALSSILTQYGLCRLLSAIKAGATLVLDARSAFRPPFLADQDEAVLVPALSG